RRRDFRPHRESASFWARRSQRRNSARCALSSTAMRSRALAFFALAFALVGLGASVASLIDYMTPAPMFCAESGCATVRNSVWAHPLGIPLPALGIAYFVAMAVLAFLPRPRLRVALAAIGAGVGVGLICLQAFEIGAWCKLCLIADPSAIVSALVVV